MTMLMVFFQVGDASQPALSAALRRFLSFL